MRQLLAKRVLGNSLPFRECHDENKQIKASPQMLHFNISQGNLKPDKKDPKMRANAILGKLNLNNHKSHDQLLQHHSLRDIHNRVEPRAPGRLGLVCFPFVRKI